MQPRTRHLSVFQWILFIFVSLSANLATAANPVSIPDSLKPWQGWVMYGIEDQDCPFLYKSYPQRTCAWPSELELKLGASGGSFEQRWRVYTRSWVRLPGDVKHWPRAVLVNRKPAIITQRDGFPVLQLEPGSAVISGRFDWRQLPESLSLDRSTALIKLSVAGKTVANPHIDQEGRLWLLDNVVKSTKSPQQDEVLAIKVYRRLVDDIPFTVITHLDLNISGDQREVVVGRVLIDSTIPTDLQSQLPARLEPNGDLRMQVRPGHWAVDITARFVEAVNELRMPKISAPLPEQEIWVFDARSYLRVVEVDGVTPIDPRQTSLPNDWKSLPTYLVKFENRFELKETRRGNPEPEPNQLHLKREMWLDFDGGGYTVRDNISGAMRRGWRMNAGDELQLGRVVVNGQPQLITRLEGSEIKGVEVRQGQLQLEADSRYTTPIGDFPVGGWMESFQKIDTTLNLPPGWRLFSARGVDNTPNTWLQSWTLLDFFLVLILSMSVARLWNRYWGLIALITFTLIWQETVDAPRYVWISVLIAIALLRVVPRNMLRRFIVSFRNVSLLALIIVSVPFMVDEVRTGIYPQLAHPAQQFDRAEKELMPSSLDELQLGSVAPSSRLFEEAPARSKTKDKLIKQNSLAMQVDPNATLQTGPGVPDWNWNKVYLSWNGPSDLQQRAQLILLSPSVNMLLNFLRVGFLLLIILLVFGAKLRSLNLKRLAKAAMVFSLSVIPVLILAPHEARADFPDEKLLEQLKQRLTKAPDCLPACASVESLAINIRKLNIDLTSTVHAYQLVAVPLPARADQWLPNIVSMDGVRVKALFRSEDGILWIAVAPGIHTIKLSGVVPDRSYFQLPLQLKPHHVTIDNLGWTVDGVSENGVPDSQVQFSRIQKQLRNKDFTQLQAGPLPPFVRVERTVQLGLEWHIVTTVYRISAANVPIVFELPLVNGEAVLDENIKVKDGRAQISLSSRQNRLTWTSSLSHQPKFKLTSQQTSDWIEVWRLDVSPIWHVTFAGIPVIHHQAKDRNWMPEWHPYPGESVDVNVSRPASTHGKSLTFDRSMLVITPGSRISESELSLTVRSSQGTQHSIRLPKDADLQAVYIDDNLEPIRQEGRRVTLPINPGKHNVKIQWRLAQGLQNYYISQKVYLNSDSVNNSVQLKFPANQWVLLTAGPRLGPAVLFWGVVIIVLILSYILKHTHLTPLKTRQWALLGIGLSQIEISFAVLVVGWLLLFGIRDRIVKQASHWVFNVVQIGLALLTLIALLVLFYAVQQGLLGQPDMQIAGNGSTAYQLNWFQDRVEDKLPRIWVLSLPLAVYRGLMLMWALWLAYSVLKWLRWVWQQYTLGGAWRKRKKEQEVVSARAEDVVEVTPEITQPAPDQPRPDSEV